MTKENIYYMDDNAFDRFYKRARYQANVEEWRIARELIDSLIMEGESHHD